MEDQRAHERISGLEKVLDKHFEAHQRFEASLSENTQLTQQIAANTAEMVVLFKGAKAFRTLIMWLSPIVAACVAAWAWAKGHVTL